MAFKLNHLPERTKKTCEGGIKLLLNRNFSVPQAQGLILEAPQKKQQNWFIKKFGSNIHLGNSEEVISAETLRLELRGDTLFDFYSIDDDMSEFVKSSNQNGLKK